MKRIMFIVLFMMLNIISFAQQKVNVTNPLLCNGKPIILGDPFMYFHKGIYYLTGTHENADKGFPCYTSKNAKDWEFKGFIWKKNSSTWVQSAFWAPEVKAYQGKFYLTYSGLSTKINGLRIGLAVSDHPEGPFQDLKTPYFDYGFGAIDGHLFVDGDKPYLYFSMNGHQDGYSFGKIYAVKLSTDLKEVLGDTIKVMEASQPWEKVNWSHNRCNEGPFVFKVKDTYYMTYSGNHTFEANYGIGYATAKSPFGPWVKAEENPIADKIPELGISGIGHNSILPTKNKNEFLIIYHTHADSKKPENGLRMVHVGLLTVGRQGELIFQKDIY
ncbi:glycoside hydrolase family 43 protein [Sphingobacterium sp. HJSM2_6]|uniref:glycoside hydrolase family 43 protein n=1 Tax=Sphingobacterium sp. HJSM2_6 TaxID=3366264 RepID=UPI003BD5A67C